MIAKPSEELIVETVSQYDAQIKKLRVEIARANKRIAEIGSSDFRNELIQAVSLPGEGGRRPHDLEEVMRSSIRAEQMERDQMNAYRRELSERLETIERIYACYCALPWEYWDLLHYLYEEDHFRKDGMDAAADARNYSRRHLQRMRMNAVQMIQSLYSLDYKTEMIFRVDPSTGELKEYV